MKTFITENFLLEIDRRAGALIQSRCDTPKQIVDNYRLRKSALAGEIPFGRGWWSSTNSRGMTWQLSTLSNIGLSRQSGEVLQLIR